MEWQKDGVIGHESVNMVHMPEDTIFHKIIQKEIPSDVVYEDDEVLVFKDINPKAPTHLLLIAKKEEDFVPSIADLTDATAHVPQMLIRKAQRLAKEKGIDGYQLKFHVGKDGGQEVFFLHLHLLSQQAVN
ncbi:MAG: HIT domain-containing protein [Kiritimatiellales bacterium]|nr:HIT domain-containing protein [Kiritimatiellales bacterium]